MAQDNESNATDDTNDEGESEDIELLEEKLNSKAVNSILARKSGPGRAWPPENNTYCGVLSCPSTTASCKDLWFFKLPVHSFDPARRAKWLEKIKRPDVQPYHRILVCERHFEPNDVGGCKIGIITPNSKKYLKKGVFPKLHLPATNNKIQKNLHQNQPKHVYKRIYQEVNKTKGYEEPSTSGKENHAFKKPKTQKGDLETSTTDNTDKIKPNTLINNETEHGVSYLLKEVEPSLTQLKPKENEEPLSTLSKTSLKTHRKLIQKFKNEPHHSKYSDECQLLIHDMYHANSHLYEALKDILNLPPISDLKSFRPLSADDLNKKCMQCLVSKVSLMSPKQKYGILCIAVVKMMPNVYYDYEWDILSGINKQAAPYRFAIIAMVQGIVADWHQIVSVYFFHDITLGILHIYRCWVDQVMLSVEKKGIYIIAVVTGTDDFFLQAYSIKEMSIQRLSTKKYYFLQNGKKVWHIFDPLHLIWCLHEEFQDNLFIFNGNCTADWEHVKEFYLRDDERKLQFIDRSLMIPPGNSHKKKLESAAETLLQRTTAAGMGAFIDMEILSEEARHTAKFLMILSDTFKHVYRNATSRGMAANINAKQEEPEKKSKKRLDNAKRIKKVIMNKKLQFFKRLKSSPKNSINKNHEVIKCLVSSFRTLHDVIEETKILEVTSSLEITELIGIFNMTPLIEFIDMIELINTKPLTSELIVETVNKSLILNEETKIKAFWEYADKLIELDSLYYREEPNISMVMKDHRSYIREYLAFVDVEWNSLMYVATYLLEKMYQQFRNVVSTRMRLMNSGVHYDKPGGGFTGTIIIPDDEFLELVIKMDTVFINYWKMAMLSGKWFAKLKEKMSKAIADVRYSGEAATLDFIGELFIHLRIYHVLKYNKNKFENDNELHEFVVRRLDGYKLDYRRVQLPSLECFRNPEYT